MVTHNDLSSLNYQFVKTNSINLNVAIAGPADGNPVILLHGFPDASFGWEKQIAALAGAGFLAGTSSSFSCRYSPS